MFYAIGSLGKTTMAHITFERPFARMNSSMNHNLTGRPITMTAQIAGVRQHLDGVRLIVFDHNIFNAKPFAACRTRKGQFARMNSHVIGQRTFLPM